MENTFDREITDEELEKLLQHVKSADQFDAAPSDDGSNDFPEETSEEVLTDEFGFAFEAEGIYNSDPIEFEEIVKELWTILISTNNAAVRYNRLSPYYIMLLQRLEKDIKQMGSYCITKAVLEQSGQQFPELDNITVIELYRMVSVHFRKCCMAYKDLRESGKGLDMSTISWVFRWATLAERLKATQDKINNIRSGKIRIETLLAKETVYKGETRRHRGHASHPAASLGKASSLPVLKSFTGEVKAIKKRAEKKKQAEQRQAERTEKPQRRGSSPSFRPSYFRPASPKKLFAGRQDETEMRKFLMDEAKSRGNMAEAGIIAQESGNQLIERFQKLQSFYNSSDPPGQGLRSGPSETTRKKLREKRKKKK